MRNSSGESRGDSSRMRLVKFEYVASISKTSSDHSLSVSPESALWILEYKEDLLKSCSSNSTVFCFNETCLFSISSINFWVSNSCFFTSLKDSSPSDRFLSSSRICFLLSSMYCWLCLYSCSFRSSSFFFFFVPF